MRTIHAVIAATVIASASTVALMTVLSARHSASGSDPTSIDVRTPDGESAQDDSTWIRARQAAARRTTAGRHPASEQPSEQEVQQQTDALMKQYEAAFQAEPVAPAWANTTELAVVDALQSPEAKAAGIAMPSDFDVECRTSVCRIDAAYSDDGAAAAAAMVLAMDVNRALPRMQRRTSYNPDGSVRVLIYALR